MYIVILRYVRPLEEIDALMGQHVQWLNKHYADGTFVASGRQSPRTGGVILARSGERLALEAMIAHDPFVSNGVATAEVIEFHPSMTAKGAEVFKAL